MEDFSSLPGTVPHTLLLMLGEDTAYASKSAARFLDVAKEAPDHAAKLAALEEAGRVVDRLRDKLGEVRQEFADHVNVPGGFVGPPSQRWIVGLVDAFLHIHNALWSIDEEDNGGATREVRLLRRALVCLFFVAWKVYL